MSSFNFESGISNTGPNLRQMPRGLYGFKEVNPIMTKRPLVIVHPYFVFDSPTSNELNDMQEYWNSPVRSLKYYLEYKKNIENLLIDPNRVVLTFEFKKNMEATALRYWQLGKRSGAYFFIWDGGVIFPPEDSSWFDVTYALIEFCCAVTSDKEAKIDVAGGFLKQESGIYNGCLGGLITRLNRTCIEVNIIEEATFG